MKNTLVNICAFIIVVAIFMLIVGVLALTLLEFISAFGVNLTFYQSLSGAYLILALGGWFNDRSK